VIVVSDLDGTLLDSSHALSPRNRRTLKDLGERGVVRVVATGRSLYSARQVLDDDFPIDYLVFSSGAGVVEWPTKSLVLVHDMSPQDALSIAEVLMQRNLDFMLHHGVPDSHRFYYFGATGSNPDFDARCERYGEFAQPWPDQPPRLPSVSQLLAIEPFEAPSQFEALDEALDRHKVILTTSPLDKSSRWIEIFPETVSKAIASAWICAELGLDHQRVLAVGNDFNDKDLLEWASGARVVANAPEELKRRYGTVGSNDDDGFSEAVEHWLIC
jgi:Cof subfamily protein (haloacid dehalogenase superfamily)